jgi:hypothetical protein
MGLLLTRLALFTGNVYFNMITRENRSFFLQSQFVIPSILGTGVVILIKSPKMTDFDMFISWTILIFILPVFFRGIRMKDLYFDPDKKDLSIRLWAFIAACFALVLFRAVFTSGLRIG